MKTITPDQVRAFAYEAVESKALEQAQVIVDDVKTKGKSALVEHAVRLGDLPSATEPYLYDKTALAAAFDGLTEQEQALLQRVAKRIEDFAQAQRQSITNIEYPIPGGKAGQDVAAVQTAGCYAPGGRYPLPSSVLMTAVTARVAGVKNVFVASPRPSPVTLAAAHVANADALLAIGGAQAIAAMAYGIENDVPSCDVIVGPGNKWVTAAKSLVSGKCAIDMLAGPSECLVVADDTASPAVIAADLLAQAEHDIAAVPILVTTSKELIDKVNKELGVQLETLSTSDVAKISVDKGFSVLCPDMETCVQVSDIMAPEHLEVITANAEDVAKKFQSYGGMFIGSRAAEVFGDYGAGPNHVLPTGGTARYTGGLSVHTFLRIRTWMKVDDPKESKILITDSAQLARMEGLEGHARAAEKRLTL